MAFSLDDLAVSDPELSKKTGGLLPESGSIGRSSRVQCCNWPAAFARCPADVTGVPKLPPSRTMPLRLDPQ